MKNSSSLNRLSLILLIAVSIVSCGNGKGFRIEGVSDGDGYAVLKYHTPDGETVADTVTITGGKYFFSGEVPEPVEGEIHLFSPDPDYGTFFFLENARLKVADGKVSGGPNNDFMRDLDAVADKVDTTSADPQKEFRRLVNECIAAHPDVESAAFMYNILNGDTPFEEFEAGFNKFTDRVKKSFLAESLVAEYESRKVVRPGIDAPLFELKTAAGETISLESLRGNYLLVDFWASWCGPCRRSMPGLKEIYAKYHDKGLEILGVSIDSDAEAWKKAMAEDGTPWIHVIDETPSGSRSSRVATIYGVRYIPSLFLIDKDGKLIGKMDHDELESWLESEL